MFGVMPRFMKRHTLLVVATLIALLPLGCSKDTPKITNIGVVELSVGKASRHVLADGRELILTPISVSTDGTVDMVASFAGKSYTNSSIKIGQVAIYLDEKTQVEMTLQSPK